MTAVLHDYLDHGALLSYKNNLKQGTKCIYCYMYLFCTGDIAKILHFVPCFKLFYVMYIHMLRSLSVHDSPFASGSSVSLHTTAGKRVLKRATNCKMKTGM